MRSNIALRSTMGFIIGALLLASCQGQSSGNASEVAITTGNPAADATALPPTSTQPDDLIVDLAQGTAEVGHPFAVETSPDGTQAVVYFQEPDSLGLFDLTTGRRLEALTGQDLHWSQGEAVSPDWTVVAAAGTDHTNRVFELSTFDTTSELPSCARPGPQAFSPNGSLVAMAGCGKSRIRVIEWRTGDVVLDQAETTKPSDRDDAGYVHDAAFTPAGAPQPGKYLAVITEEGLEIHDIESGRQVFGPKFPKSLRLAFDPTGRFLAVGNEGGTALVLDFEALIGDAGSDPMIRQIEAHPDLVIDIDMNQSGVLGTSAPGSVRLWNVESGDMMDEVMLDPEIWNFVDFQPTGEELVYTDAVDLSLRTLQSDG